MGAERLLKMFVFSWVLVNFFARPSSDSEPLTEDADDSGGVDIASMTGGVGLDDLTDDAEPIK